MDTHGVIPPSRPTLARYGLALEDWAAICARQGWRCPICERHLSRVRTNIDHEHVAGWKKLPPERRRAYVRGVLCVRCNWKTVPDPTPPSQHLANLLRYIVEYEERYAAGPLLHD